MNSSYETPASCGTGLLETFEKRLHQPASSQAFFCFIIVINIITFPFTVVLNALVMIAVKTKSRLRATKSNILLALLASTDFLVGAAIQPPFIVVIILLLSDQPVGYCLLKFLTRVLPSLTIASLFHLALISGERYLAMKHPFAYINIVTESRLLIASVLVYVLSFCVQFFSLVDQSILVLLSNISFALPLVFIIFCHVKVYFVTRRHEKQIAGQQVTQEARQQCVKNRKALKLTSIVLGVLLVCFIPMGVMITLSSNYAKNEITLETLFKYFLFAFSMALMNSFLNPLIYSIRIRELRVASIELMCRTASFAEAGEIERRIFGTPNTVTVVSLGAGHENAEGQQYVEQENSNNIENTQEETSRKLEHFP